MNGEGGFAVSRLQTVITSIDTIHAHHLRLLLVYVALLIQNAYGIRKSVAK